MASSPVVAEIVGEGMRKIENFLKMRDIDTIGSH